ncbi:MAG: cohesin domain-containing protein, partial [Thermoproteota archaeon]
MKISLLILTVLIIESLSTTPYQVLQPAYTIARIVSEKDQVGPREIFTVKVDITPEYGVGISAADVTVSFDASVLEALSIDEGTLLGDSPLSVMRKINNSEGFVRYAAARQGSTPVPTQ